MCRSRDTPPGAYPPTFARGGPSNNDNDVSSSAAGRDIVGAGIAIRPARDSRLETIYQFVRQGHISPHGIRKGSATPRVTQGGPNKNDGSSADRDKAGAGIAIRPDHRWRSFRGEWSMEKVLDLYKY